MKSHDTGSDNARSLVKKTISHTNITTLVCALNIYNKINKANTLFVGLGDLGVRLDIQGSNPAEADGFFQDVKFLSTSPPSWTSTPGP